MSSYRSFGMFGLVVLAFGVLAGFASGDWTSRYVVMHLVGGVALLALYLFTHLESLREQVTGRKAQHGTNTVVYTLLTLGVLVLVNYLAAQNSFRWDATEQGIFSLAPATEQALAGLDDEIEVYAFFRSTEPAAESVRQLLETYADGSDRFTFQLVDPDQRPELAQQMEVTQYGTLVLTDGTETTRITESTEEALTNALIRFTSAQRKKVYFVTGHGEPEIDVSDTPFGFGQLAASLENEGYEVDSLLLGAVPDVPGDADVLVIAGPQPDRQFLPGEIEVLERYLDRGGAALVMIDPRAGAELGPVLARRGLRLGENVLVDQVMQLFAGPRLGTEPVVSDYGSHPITQEFSQRTVFTLARSVEPVEELPDGVTTSILARTSPRSWAESDVTRLFENQEAGLDEDDTEGPVPVAAAATLASAALSWTEPSIATKPESAAEADDAVEEPGDEETTSDAAATGDDTGGADEPEEESAADAETADAPAAEEEQGGSTPPADLEGRLVVFGDSDWVTNSKLGLYYNEDLALNSFSWLSGTEETISIRPRTRRASQVVLTAAQNRAVFYSAVLLLPEIVLLAGLAIWWRRRR